MQLAAALIYWVIVVLWLAVFVTVCLSFVRAPRMLGAAKLLLLVVAIDTFRNIFENVYFGLFFGSQYGLLPTEIAKVLGQPYLLVAPKILNVIAACVVLGLLLLRWLPRTIQERADSEREVRTMSEAVSQEAEEQRRLLETSIDAILVTDRKGNLLRVSPSAAAGLGYAIEEMIGRNAGDFIHPDDLESTRDRMRLARSGQHTQNFESRYIHRDGDTVTLDWTGVWSEEVQRHFFIGRDTTERRKLEQELRQSQKMEAIGQLTGGIAHDYNNLLTVILGNTELLLEALQDRPELLSLANTTLEAAERSAALTQRLLAFGRRQSLAPQTTDINELLDQMRDLLRLTLGANVRKELRKDPDLWPSRIDRGQLENAIVNLCVNARDAMPNGGTLIIETKNAVLDDDYIAARPDVSMGDYVEVSVSDSGSGMSKEVQLRVFEPFFTTKEVGKGTGLGLSMVYGFVKQSGGHVAVYSEIGVGTVVRLYLPRAELARLTGESEAPSQQMEAPTGSECILLVEDDALVRRHAERQLTSLGYQVQTATNADDAILQIESGKQIDLMLTDIIMPGKMNGWELAEAVHEHRPDLKVVFMSGYAPGLILQDDNNESRKNFIRKPFRRAELAMKIREVLDNAEGGAGNVVKDILE